MSNCGETMGFQETLMKQRSISFSKILPLYYCLFLLWCKLCEFVFFMRKIHFCNVVWKLLKALGDRQM